MRVTPRRLRFAAIVCVAASLGMGALGVLSLLGVLDIDGWLTVVAFGSAVIGFSAARSNYAVSKKLERG